MPGTQIKVFDKIVQVIELLATSSHGVTLKKTQQLLGFNKATAFRILRTLESHDVAARNGDGTFLLGNRVLWWERSRRQNFDLAELARPHLEKLRDLTSETVIFSVLMGDRTVVVNQATSRHATSTRVYIGFSAPLNAGATGRIVLAHLAPERRKKILDGRLERLTPHTLADKKQLERDLQRCLAQGYAFSLGQRLPNSSSVAAPVFGAQHEVLGAMSVLGPSDRLTPERCKSIVPMLLKETRLLTERIKGPQFADKRAV